MTWKAMSWSVLRACHLCVWASDGDPGDPGCQQALCVGLEGNVC